LPAGTLTQRPLTPVNGYIRFNTDSDLLEYFDGGNWVSVVSVGPGPTPGPTVGLGLTVSGAAIKVSIPIQFGPPAPGTGQLQSVDGSLYWDNNLGLLFIRYNDGNTTQWVQVVPSGGGGGGGGGVTQLVAGTNVTLSPAGGTGVVTINATGGGGGTYTGTAPIDVTGTAVSLNIGLGNLSDGGFLKASTPIQAGPPAAGTGQLQAIDGSLYWDNNQGLLFIRYDDGNTTQWVQVTPVTPAPTGFSGSFLTQGGQTVTVSNGIILSVV
jgi:hypothetical protein